MDRAPTSICAVLVQHLCNLTRIGHPFGVLVNFASTKFRGLQLHVPKAHWPRHRVDSLHALEFNHLLNIP